MENLGYFVYVIKSKSTDKFYTGLTSDIDRRVKEHNQHLSNVKVTKDFNDYELFFCSWFKTRTEARIVEKYLKSGSGREFRDNLVK
jgi:putative endonuclease